MVRGWEAASWSRKHVVSSSAATPPRAGVSATVPSSARDERPRRPWPRRRRGTTRRVLGQGLEREGDPVGRGLGGVVDRDRDGTGDVEGGMAGEERGDVTVGTDAEHEDVEGAPPSARTTSEYDAAAVSASGTWSAAGISWTRVAPTCVEERCARLDGIAVGGVGRRGTARRRTRSAPHPSRPGRRRHPGDLAVHGVGDRAAGQADVRDVPGRLRVGNPVEQLAGHRGGQGLRVGLDLDQRGRAVVFHQRRCLR